eukprot:CAMPEP_0172088270 /NCGR_PEP_ID=MMETSP1043-20130122/23146_1 /TAXON_ID=464988 /ORGANISM="Hemiselmis andersenii, Strain CCMP441" /LENGTH=678 /DNA_ID=CAMNT_0012750567 /DNA_START=14 /DNA_END=2051 /DNA_ORIENTATION=-
MTEGLGSSSHSSIFFATHPITAASARWPFQVFLTIIVAYTLCSGVLSSIAYQTHANSASLGPFQYFRLETRLTRNGSTGEAIWSPGVSDFGIIGPSGCTGNTALIHKMSHHHEEQLWTPQDSFQIGSSFVIGFSTPREMDGWYLRTASQGGSEGADPSFFTVWATNEAPQIGDGSCGLARDGENWFVDATTIEWCGATWDRVGTPKWRYTAPIQSLFMEVPWWDLLALLVDLPLERGRLETFLLKPAWYTFHFWWILPHLFIGLSALLTVVSGVFSNKPIAKYLPAPHKTLALGFGSAVCDALCMLHGRHTAPCDRGAVCVCTSAVASCVVRVPGPKVYLRPVGLHFARPRHMGCAVLLDVALGVRQQHGAHWAHFQRGHPHWEAKGSVALKEASQAGPDEDEGLWRTLMANKDGVACIEHLTKVVRMIGLDDKNYCRQHNRLRADNLPPQLRAKSMSNAAPNLAANPLFADLGRMYLQGRPDSNSQVTSCNQLYAQAALANLLLSERVKVWAEMSQGMFRVDSEGSEGQKFAKWRDIKDDPNMVAKVHWTHMKRHGRAIEKLLRSYQNSPSKLLDISRNSVIFENMTHLTNCLGIIVTDENVRVERLKNRLSPDYDPEETEGYRDVCINLRIINKQAQGVGAELHICEVQLLLLEFAALKTFQGHQRYVSARNTRGT